MKKLIMVMMVIMPVIVAHGATICSKNDTIIIALDPAITGKGSSYNQAYSTWWTAFPYGTVRGLSACLSGARGQSMGGTVSQLTDTNPTTNESARVVGGETNGQYCWCRMTHPALSRWAFYGDRGATSACASNCAYLCGLYVQNNSVLRAGLFGSVASN